MGDKSPNNLCWSGGRGGMIGSNFLPMAFSMSILKNALFFPSLGANPKVPKSTRGGVRTITFQDFSSGFVGRGKKMAGGTWMSHGCWAAIVRGIVWARFPDREGGPDLLVSASGSAINTFRAPVSRSGGAHCPATKQGKIFSWWRRPLLFPRSGNIVLDGGLF